MDEPEITIIYRCTSIESINKVRPGNLKKLDLIKLCLTSAVMAFKDVKVKWVILVDKPTVGLMDMIDDIMLGDYTAETSQHGDWNSGNIGSFHRQLDIAAEINGKVLFLEDDYYLLPGSGRKIVDALNTFQFISIYDHPGYYAESKHLGEQNAGFALRKSGQQWVTVDSTTLTFGSHGKYIKQQKETMKKYGWADSEMWEDMTKPKDFDFDYPAHEIALYTPVPTLATHMELDLLSPNIDWGRYFQL